jgi:transcription-repair coupling factor (superfamily II helicase)
MEAIGYELYTKLLEESIRKAKGEPVKEKIETNISLNVNAYIPENYISHVNHKLEMYKKVSLIEREEEVVDLQIEFIDRFGDLPKAVVALIDIAYLKVMLEALNISEVIDKGRVIGFYFTDDGSFDLDILSMLMIEYKRKVKVPDQFKPYFEYSFRNKEISEYEKLQEINNMIKKVYKAFN